MRNGLISMGVLAALTLAACGGSDAGAEAADDAATDATTDAPLFSDVGLAELRAAGGAQIEESLGYLSEECGSAPVGFEPGAIRSADFNGDGRPDFLVDMTGFTCGGENRGNGWCGSGGCSFDIYVSREEDFHLDAFLGMGLEIVRVGDRVGVSVMGRNGPWTVAWDGEAMSPVETSPAEGGEEAAVRAVVSSIYDAYVAGVDSGATIPDGVESDALQRAVTAASDPEMGGLGFDYYCGCQDYGDVSYDITEVVVNGDQATASVDFTSYGRLSHIDLILRKSGSRWQVDDVRDEHGSLRAGLAG